MSWVCSEKRTLSFCRQFRCQARLETLGQKSNLPFLTLKRAVVDLSREMKKKALDMNMRVKIDKYWDKKMIKPVFKMNGRKT